MITQRHKRMSCSQTCILCFVSSVGLLLCVCCVVWDMCMIVVSLCMVSSNPDTVLVTVKLSKHEYSYAVLVNVQLFIV